MERPIPNIALKQTYVRRHFQITAELAVRSSVENTVWYGGTLIYQWAQKKFVQFETPDKLPRKYSRDYGGNRLDILYDPQEQYFCMYVQHPDSSVAGRMWIVDAEIRVIGGVPRLAVRQVYTYVDGEEAAAPPPTIPRFVLTLAAKNGLIDVIPLDRVVHEAACEEDVDALIALIRDPARHMPVIVASEKRDDTEYAEYLSGYYVDTEEMVRHISVLAHIFRLPYEMAQLFTAKVGSSLGVYQGAVRTYYAGVDLTPENAFMHPYVPSDRILASHVEDENGNEYVERDAFRRILEDKIKTNNARARIDFTGLGHSFFFRANQLRLQKAQENTSTDDIAALDELYREEIESLKRTVESKDNEILEYLGHDEAMEQEMEDLRRQLFYLRSRNEELANRLASAGGRDEDIPIPETYAELPDWAGTYFSGRLHITSRAVGSLKNAAYEDVALVYRCLILLGTTYYRMRTSDEVSRKDFDEACALLGVDEAGAITDTRAGEEGATYFIQYHGMRRKLERHLRKGSARDPKTCMRIYFFWDDDDSLVVICSLPQHLDIRSS